MLCILIIIIIMMREQMGINAFTINYLIVAGINVSLSHNSTRNATSPCLFFVFVFCNYCQWNNFSICHEFIDLVVPFERITYHFYRITTLPHYHIIQTNWTGIQIKIKILPSIQPHLKQPLEQNIRMPFHISSLSNCNSSRHRQTNCSVIENFSNTTEWYLNRNRVSLVSVVFEFSY